MVLIPSARFSVASSGSASDSGTVLQKAAADAISTAAGNGLRSCTVSLSGKSSTDVQALFNLARNILGYTLSVSGTTLTVSW